MVVININYIIKNYDFYEKYIYFLKAIFLERLFNWWWPFFFWYSLWKPCKRKVLYKLQAILIIKQAGVWVWRERVDRQEGSWENNMLFFFDFSKTITVKFTGYTTVSPVSANQVFASLGFEMSRRHTWMTQAQKRESPQPLVRISMCHNRASGHVAIYRKI